MFGDTKDDMAGAWVDKVCLEIYICVMYMRYIYVMYMSNIGCRCVPVIIYLCPHI